MKFCHHFQLTGEAEEIFGVEVTKLVGRTLEVDKVDAEMAAKRHVLQKIRDLEKTLPIEGREWLEYFRKLVNADMKIVESLATDLSFLNTENFRNLKNNQELKDLMSNADWKIFQTGLQNYTILMQTFNFEEIVWNRKFVQNPFEYFFTTINKENPNYLVIKKLKPAFKDAYTSVSKAQNKIAKIVSGLISNLSSQRAQSKLVMAELRDLDIFAVRGIKTKIESRVKASLKVLEKLLKSVENVNKIPIALRLILTKKAWLDNIIEHLEAVELAHKNLEIAISIIYP